MSTSHMEAARDAAEYDECEHGVPLSADCIDCLKRRHHDEIVALNQENDRLHQAIESAICMLCEGPDALESSRLAGEQAIKILREVSDV